VKITSVEATRFRYRSRVVRDEEGHTHPGPEHDAVQTLTTVKTDEGVEGHCFGGSPDLARLATRILEGEHPLDREWIWQRLRQNQRSERVLLDDRNIGVIDQALWDLAGQLTHLPVYRLIGGYRDKVLAYASTMCGDDIPGGLDTPESYARFALACKERGYKALKLHTWMWPLGPNARHDVAACAAVREAVGPDMPLMLDCHHDYSREDALYIGRELEKLGFHWIEEPMPEHSVSSYVWLTEQLDIPVVGPETAEGKMYTRAEWIVRGASDISRGGVQDVGGITPLLKIAHLCESFGVAMEARATSTSSARWAFPASTTSAACSTRCSTTRRRLPGSARSPTRSTPRATSTCPIALASGTTSTGTTSETTPSSDPGQQTHSC
jgi:L-alanine-DL-glutamate epimerase-like enolase superfamily enzyme